MMTDFIHNITHTHTQMITRAGQNPPKNRPLNLFCRHFVFVVHLVGRPARADVSDGEADAGVHSARFTHVVVTVVGQVSLAACRCRRRVSNLIERKLARLALVR